MDIPVPSEESSKSEVERIPVTLTSAKPAPAVQTVSLQSARFEDKTSAVSPEDQQRIKIAELISSKKYYLGIKEKRSSPLLTIGSTTKKSKKTKKKTPKDNDKKISKSPSNHTQLIQAAVLIVLLLGILVAIDAGVLNIGINLPFDLIKS